MPQIHLQSVFSISLFLKQKVTTQAYNKSFQMHALSKNPRKCFIFSIDSPFKFQKNNKKVTKWDAWCCKKEASNHALKTSICSFQISCHFNPTSWRQKKSVWKERECWQPCPCQDIIVQSNKYELLKRLFSLVNLVFYPSPSSLQQRETLKKVGEKHF